MSGKMHPSSRFKGAWVEFMSKASKAMMVPPIGGNNFEPLMSVFLARGE